MNTRLLFHIFYTSFFTVLNIVLLGLLLITPGDAIRQALINGQIYYAFVIAGCYVLTVALAFILYGARLLTNRSVLQGIPKTWIPVEKGEVSESVRKIIVASLSRSAAIAWDSRPRGESQPPTPIVAELDIRDAVVMDQEAGTVGKGKKRDRVSRRKHPKQAEKDDETVAIPGPQPAWGNIAHDGWSSPTSPDLPNLQYTTVILELPHLIEARAVSMAPADPESASDPPMPDLQAVDLLQRPASMGLRDYISHLTSLGIFTSPTTEFLAAYEHARFSSQPLTEAEFRHLMAQFAELLRNMQPLSRAFLESLDLGPPESDIDDDVSSSCTPRSRSLASAHTPRSRRGSEDATSTPSSPSTGTNSLRTNKKKKRQPEFSTAPATPRSRKQVVSRSPSLNTLALQNSRLYEGSSAGSSESLRSSSARSVIRLSSTYRGRDGELPYILSIPGAR